VNARAGRPGALAAGLACGLWLGTGGCQSARQKCDEARTAAQGVWAGYVAALERAHAAALQTRGDSRAKLEGDVERRLAPGAQNSADSRYDRSSSAWLRAYQSAYHDACTADAECAGLTQKNIDAKAAVEDLDERLGLARAARDAAGGDLQRAATAAAAVIVHPEYPQLKQAQLLTRTMQDRCKGLPPPKAP
jgi:hypothetical protein